jgi:hypothetical protein
MLALSNLAEGTSIRASPRATQRIRVLHSHLVALSCFSPVARFSKSLDNHFVFRRSFHYVVLSPSSGIGATHALHDWLSCFP